MEKRNMDMERRGGGSLQVSSSGTATVDTGF